MRLVLRLMRACHLTSLAFMYVFKDLDSWIPEARMEEVCSLRMLC